MNTLISPIEYEPDRGVSPTLVFPDVRAIDVDNVFTHGSANEYLALDSISWTVDGEPIADVWTAGKDYDIITTADDTRGTLRIYKNLAAGDSAVLHFEGSFLDWRTGISYTVASDDKTLSCTDKGADILNVTVDKPLVEYDPLFDDLLLYEYKAAKGYPVQGSRADYINGKSYEQTVTVVATSGKTQLTSLPDGIMLRLVSLGSNTSITPNSEANPEVLAIGYPTIKFDMRMIGKREYEVQLFTPSRILARCTVGLNTHTTMPLNGKPVFGADIAASQDYYENGVLLNLADRVVEYPELYYLIQWYTQAKYNDNGTWKYAAEKTWQRGVNMNAAVKDLGIGVTVNDSFFDIWFDADPHAPCELIADEDGNVLTDENGNFLID
ncbi:MAG: hypothetical protein IJ640_09310 [Prevotella sp.]|nr:hypothetical protein [Prevotella sp.]